MPLRIPSPHRFPSLMGWLFRPMAWLIFGALIFLSAALAFLLKSGELLVEVGVPMHTRWAAVLPGEERDFERMDAALALYQEGMFDSLILSGPRIFKTRYISEFSSEYLIARGFPRDRIFQLQNEGQSSVEEAVLILGQARRLGIDTLLIITSDYHTARVGRIYRKLAAGFPEVRLAASQGVFFDSKAWWSSRDSRETWVFEWIKTLNTAWENRRLKALEGAAELSLLLPDPRSAFGEENIRKDSLPAKPSVPGETAQTADSAKTAVDTVTAAVPDTGSRQ